MELDEKIMVNKENLQKIREKLTELEQMIEDNDAHMAIEDILELLDNELKPRNVLLARTIKKKMTETKYSNPELHFKLYMLYRKLTEGKIDEEQAEKAYELYVII